MFDVRGTHALPEQVLAPPSQWATAGTGAVGGLRGCLRAVGEEAAQALDEAVALYTQGMAAGECALEEAAFMEEVRNFWEMVGRLPTSPALSQK